MYAVIFEIKSAGDTVGLWTRSPKIVLVAEEYIRYDLWGRALIDEIGQDAFGRLCARSRLLKDVVGYQVNSGRLP